MKSRIVEATSLRPAGTEFETHFDDILSSSQFFQFLPTLNPPRATYIEIVTEKTMQEFRLDDFEEK